MEVKEKKMRKPQIMQDLNGNIVQTAAVVGICAVLVVLTYKEQYIIVSSTISLMLGYVFRGVAYSIRGR